LNSFKSFLINLLFFFEIEAIDMKKIKKINSKINLSLLGMGAMLVDQAVASLRSSVDSHSVYLSEAAVALDHISADQSATSDAEISEQLAALNALVQSELAMVSGYPDDLQLFALDEVIGQEADKSILLAQANTSAESVTDLPNQVLAQLSQLTSQESKSPAAPENSTKKATQNGDDDDRLLWLAKAGALAGLALISNDSNSAPTDTPIDKTGPKASISIANKTLVAGQETTVTITFSEVVKNLGLSDFELPNSNGLLSDLKQSLDNPLVWTAKIVATVATSETSSMVVNLFGAYTDVAGNEGAGSGDDGDR
jgi:hypothetical protein